MISPIILFAIPGFLLLIILELIAEKIRKTDYYRLNDAFGSLSLGIVSRTSKLITISVGVLVINEFIVDWQVFNWSADHPLTWILAFIVYDLTYYWFHRCSHMVNFLWAGHVIHHSSEEYNLTTALRQTSTGIFDWIFSIPMLLLGVPVEVYLACAALNLVYQYWVHTQQIHKMGLFETLFVTPSHHRVHHAQNACYIDKNHGGVFIIWDKLFGTFQPELESEPPIFGVRRPLKRFNPLSANFQVWFGLLKDAWYARRWWDKLRIWFMPTGWRPADVEQRFPIAKSELSQFKKYDPPVAPNLKLFSWFQLLTALPANVILLLNAGDLSIFHLVLCWLLLTAPLISTGYLLEGRPAGLKVELIRLAVSWGVFVYLGVNLPVLVWWFVLGYLLVNSVMVRFIWGEGFGGRQVSV